MVREPRPSSRKPQGARTRVKVAGKARRSQAGPAAPPAKKTEGRHSRTSANPGSAPESWPRRLREQSHNLARAIEMLEQALTLMAEPRAHSLARAECLRGAGLLTLLAASELLVVAGWFEADQAVSGGTLDP